MIHVDYMYHNSPVQFCILFSRER